MTDLSKYRPDFEGELTPERREAIYSEVEAARGSRSRRGWYIASGVAAVVVLAVSIPALVHVGAPDPASNAGAPAVARTTTAPEGFGKESPAQRRAEVENATQPQDGLTWQLGAVATPAALEKVAVAAETRGGRGPDGYRHVIQVVGERGPNNEVIPNNIDETFIDAEGWAWRRRSYAAEDRNEVEWSKTAPNPDLTGLPTDPAALEAHFRREGGGSPDDEQVLTSATKLLAVETPPALRGAALRVLANLSRHPEDSQVTLNEVEYSDGTLGYRVHLEDPSSAAGGGHSVFISATGILIGAEHDARQEAPWAAEITVDELVPSLPEAFSRRLGAEQVPMEEVVVDNG